MNLKIGGKNGDGPLILGCGVYLVASQIQLTTTGVLEMLAMLLSLAGILWTLSNLRRSNVERAIRWFLGANLFHAILTLARSAAIAEHAVSRILVLALVISLLGSLVPTAMRRKGYGVLLAFLWATLLGAGWEELRAGSGAALFLVASGAGLLTLITVFYARWARTEELPFTMQGVFHRLPADDSPLYTTYRSERVVESLPEAERITSGAEVISVGRENG